MWSKTDLQAALGVQMPFKESKSRVVINSKIVQKQDIFIGIKGEKFDGSIFVQQALNNGANFCIVHGVPEVMNIQNEKIMIVKDTFKDGLMKLANYNRNVKYKNATYIGVTGSVGKTTTKQMLKLVFSQEFGNCFATEGNLNNNIGLPLTLTNINCQMKIGVFQMGMSAKGQILNLSQILKPDISVITAIAPGHLQYFNSLQEIAKAKAEIIEHTKQFLILNLQSPFADLIIEIANKKQLKIIGYATTKVKQWNLYGLVIIKSAKQYINEQKNMMTSVEVQFQTQNIPKTQATYQIKGVGEDQVLNSCAVFGCLLAYLPKFNTQALSHLQKFNAVKGRGQLFNLNKMKAFLIDETYNCNPKSLDAALNRVSRISTLLQSSRKIVALGDMLELGKDQIQFHQSIKQNILKEQINVAYCVGKRMKFLYESLIQSNFECYWTQNSQQMVEIIVKQIKQNDLIMVKGSNSMKMQKICFALINKNNSI